MNVLCRIHLAANMLPARSIRIDLSLTFNQSQIKEVTMYSDMTIRAYIVNTRDEGYRLIDTLPTYTGGLWSICWTGSAWHVFWTPYSPLGF